MYCPKCNDPSFSPGGPCAQCGFSADVAELETLSHLNFLLLEASQWTEIPFNIRESLLKRYQLRRETVEIRLGLRAMPLDAETARALQLERGQLEIFSEVLPGWARRGWITGLIQAGLEAETGGRLEWLTARLADTPAGEVELTALERARFLYSKIEELHSFGELANEEAYLSAAADFGAAIRRLEVKVWGQSEAPVAPEVSAGPEVPEAAVEMVLAENLATPVASEAAAEPATSEASTVPSRPASKITAERLQQIYAPAALVSTPASRPVSTPVPTPAIPPRKPFSWDRVWEVLLSEQTLRVLLFMGVMLLFGAGVSLVVWNWGLFPPLVQVGLIGLITAIFYALGWYVRSQLHLESSGIALSAVASLLVPLDFYAVFLFGKFPGSMWDEVWLMASAVCLFVYLATTLLMNFEFFGYLVVLAAGSLLAAIVQVSGLPGDIRWAALTGLALGLVLLSELFRGRWGRLSLLSTPFSHMALAIPTVILPLALGWRLIGFNSSLVFSGSLVVAWWLGGLVYLWGARRYRVQMGAVVPAAVFPIAMSLTQWVLFSEFGISYSWYALGWALLAPVYFILGKYLLGSNADPVQRGDALIVIGVGTLLMVAAAGGALTSNVTVAVVYPLLAATILLPVLFWQLPWLLLVGSGFLLFGMMGGMTVAGFSIAQLGWGGLALVVLHLAAAGIIQLVGKLRYAVPLYWGAWGTALLTMILPLVDWNRGILTCVGAGWIVANLWLAVVIHLNQKEMFFSDFSVWRNRVGISLQGAAAVSLLGWLWLFESNFTSALSAWSVGYILLAWVLLLTSWRLSKLNREYRRPWEMVAHLAMGIGLTWGVFSFQGPGVAAALIGASIFYFVGAFLLESQLLLAPGAFLLPVGLLAVEIWLDVPGGWWPVLPALVVPLYVGAGSLLEWRRWATPSFLGPLYISMQIIAGLNLYVIAAWALIFYSRDMVMLVSALTLGNIALAFIGYAWLRRNKLYSFAAAGFGVLALCFLAGQISSGWGDWAFWLAGFVMIGLLVERSLWWIEKRGLNSEVRKLYDWALVSGECVLSGVVIVAAMASWTWEPHLPLLSNLGILALLMMVIFYALSAACLRLEVFVWLAAVVIILPWTWVANRIGYLPHAVWFVRYSPAWTVLAFGELVIGIGGAWIWRPAWWNRPLRLLAYLGLPVVLVCSLWNEVTGSLSLGLGVAAYSLAVAADRRFKKDPVAAASGRFLYLVLGILPLWACYLLFWIYPQAPQAYYGLLVLSFSLPMLVSGWFFSRREPNYRWPLYCFAAVTAVLGTAFSFPDSGLLSLALIWDTALLALCVVLFQESIWIYPMAVTLAMGIAAAGMGSGSPFELYGWILIALGGSYLAAGRVVGGIPWSEKWAWLKTTATPLWVVAFFLITVGLFPSSFSRFGALVGYGGAAVFYLVGALWWEQPMVLGLAAGAGFVPYWVMVLQLGVKPVNYGVALWPVILFYLAAAWLLDRFAGILPDKKFNKPWEAFPWWRPLAWWGALGERLFRWWAGPLYFWASGAAFVSVLVVPNDRLRFCILGWGTAAVYGWMAYHFRLRGWLLAALGMAELAFIAGVRWIKPDISTGELLLICELLMWLTALVGWLIELGLREGSPVSGRWAQGWSRPFYAFVGGNLLLAQGATFFPMVAESAPLSLSHALLLAVLATLWISPVLAYVPPAFLGVAVWQYLVRGKFAGENWPWALAVLTVVCGASGYGLRYVQQRGVRLPPWMQIWEKPLARYGVGFSGLAMLLALTLGAGGLGLLVLVLFGQPISSSDVALYQSQVEMWISVLALLGLFYLIASLASRRRWWGYGALLLLLSSWGLQWLMVWDWREVQLYALPTGLYLLGIGYLEWSSGSRSLARWVDRAAMVLMLGSVFWQSMVGDYRWVYSGLMVIESVAFVIWGSGRRLRRFLYAGVAGVLIAVAGQAVDPLLSGNLVFYLVIGLLLIGLAILIEPRLKQIQTLSQDVRERLESWE